MSDMITVGEDCATGGLKPKLPFSLLWPEHALVYPLTILKGSYTLLEHLKQLLYNSKAKGDKDLLHNLVSYHQAVAAATCLLLSSSY